MTLHLIQTDLHWENPEANRRHLASRMAGLTDGVAILPEMFSTGFSMASDELAEPMDGPTTIWMRETAKAQALTLCGSLIIEDGGRYYNRFLWVTPAGDLTHYDKRHLFRMADEHRHYACGTQNITLRHGGLRIRPQICYDLRFPGWCRNRDDYDVLLYVANWPRARREHWLALLRARAIENLCYVVGVNRIGIDGKGVAYSGDSLVFGPEGETLLNLGGEDGVQSINPDIDSLISYRRSFPAHLDADDLEIGRASDP